MMTLLSIWRRKFDKVLIGRKQYRIEFNWNAYVALMEFYEMKFGDLKDFEKINPGQFITLLYEAIVEGCRLENKKFPYSRENFAAMLTPESISQFSLILQRQNANSGKDLKKDT